MGGEMVQTSDTFAFGTIFFPFFQTRNPKQRTLKRLYQKLSKNKIILIGVVGVEAFLFVRARILLS